MSTKFGYNMTSNRLVMPSVLILNVSRTCINVLYRIFLCFVSDEDSLSRSRIGLLEMTEMKSDYY